VPDCQSLGATPIPSNFFALFRTDCGRLFIGGDDVYENVKSTNRNTSRRNMQRNPGWAPRLQAQHLARVRTESFSKGSSVEM